MSRKRWTDVSSEATKISGTYQEATNENTYKGERLYKTRAISGDYIHSAVTSCASGQDECTVSVRVNIKELNRRKAIYKINKKLSR